jgi:hypothetical protein
MNYQLIKDEAILIDFINWLPDTKPFEKYYVSLFARKKYCNNKDDLKSSKAQLKRFITDKKDLLQKIKQLEVKKGLYEFDGISVPEESLALYISVNPSDMEYVAKKMLIELANKITEPYSNYNPISIAHNCAQQGVTKRTKRFIRFDYDNITYEQIKDELTSSINHEAYSILKTRGGLHILINPNKVLNEYNKLWYQRLSKIANCDITSDYLIPIPGCTQGNFIPYFLKKEENN